MRPLPPATALVVIDVQQGFDDPVWGTRNNPDAEARIAGLLAAWRESGRPVVIVQHDSASPASPLRPGQPGNDLKPAVRPRPGELHYRKRVNSALIGTTLGADLRALGVESVVITGLVTNHCVSTTARMAANLGFRTIVVSDATATFDTAGPDGRRWSAQEMHDMELAALHGEFAEVAAGAEVVAALEAAAPA
jgi:nicotinamidase-related amidase